MLWPGALSAVFLLQCGGDAERSERRTPPRAGSAGLGTGGLSRDGGAGGVQAGKGGRAGDSASGGPSGGSRSGGAGGSAGADAVGGGSPAAGKGGTAGAGKGGAAGAGSGGTSGASGAPGEGGEAGNGITDDGVKLAKVSAYQSVEVALFSGRQGERNAPIVIGRRTLVRAFLSPGGAFMSRPVTGTLTVDDGTSLLELSASIANLDGASSQPELDSTLNFDVPAGRITSTTTLRLVVSDESGELLRFPESAPLALEAEDANGALVVTIVPLVVNGFAPDLSEMNQKSYTTLLRGMMPVPNVDVIVRAPLELDFDVTAEGAGWYEALDELYALRAADEPADNVYYYGLLSPGATFDDWCPDGCTVGLSVVASAAEVEYRGSIGVGFFETPRDTFAPETMVHELGHALGREHSPCGTDDPDPRFPYGDGSIGSWGYYGGVLHDPSEDADVMGYCTPVWVSDYTFDRWFSRIAYVNGTQAIVLPGTAARGRRETVRPLTVRADGSLGWGRERPGSMRGSGTPTNVELLDEDGRVLSIVSAPFARLDHLPGGFVTLPSSVLSAPGVASVRALGRTLPTR
jgi:hypothetical protein